MTVAPGARRGSALSTPSTSVQMMISPALSRSPKMAPEKSLPLRPSVVCSPCSSRATKPGAISMIGPSRGRPATPALARDASHCTAGPRAPCWMRMISRESIHSTARLASGDVREEHREQARRPQLSRAGDDFADAARRLADQLNGLEHAVKIVAVGGQAADVRHRRRRRATRAQGRHDGVRMASSFSTHAGSRRSAASTSASRSSVTPRHADRTTAWRGAGSASRISATLRKQAASATLDPPNLCTRHASTIRSFTQSRIAKCP